MLIFFCNSLKDESWLKHFPKIPITNWNYGQSIEFVYNPLNLCTFCGKGLSNCISAKESDRTSLFGFYGQMVKTGVRININWSSIQ